MPTPPTSTPWVPVWKTAEPIPAFDLAYKGAYSGAASYKDGDIVAYNGILYLCVSPAVGNPPEDWGIPNVGIGTSLPASPVDGQEFILVDNLTAPAYSWRFRYLATVTDAYKWLFVGGAPHRTWGGTAVAVDVNEVDLGMPILFTPRTGMYRLEWGLSLENTGSFVAVYAPIGRIKVGATTISTVEWRHQTAQFIGSAVAYSQDITLTQGDPLRMTVNLDRSNGSTCAGKNGWIHMFPLRVI